MEFEQAGHYSSLMVTSFGVIIVVSHGYERAGCRRRGLRVLLFQYY